MDDKTLQFMINSVANVYVLTSRAVCQNYIYMHNAIY